MIYDILHTSIRKFIQLSNNDLKTYNNFLIFILILHKRYTAHDFYIKYL